MDIKQLQIGEEVSVLAIDPRQFEIARPGYTAGHCVSMVLDLIKYEQTYHDFTPMHQFATMEASARKVYRSCTGGLLAKYEGIPVGLLLTRDDNPTHIASLIVLECVRGHGVGKELVTRFCQWYAHESITVSVHRENKRAKEFYEKIGFLFTDHPKESFLLSGIIAPISQF